MEGGKAAGEEEEEEIQVVDDGAADTSGHERVTLPPVVEEVTCCVCVRVHALAESSLTADACTDLCVCASSCVYLGGCIIVYVPTPRLMQKPRNPSQLAQSLKVTRERQVW